jgi:hypothetical protein
LIRLHFLVEGESEEAFVQEVLGPHLWSFEVTSAVCSMGGAHNFQRWQRDLRRWMRSDQNADARFTSMVDLYRLPSDFPSTTPSTTDPLQRVEHIERAIAAEIADRRFIPYVQLHEFEALLLTAPESFASVFPGRTIAVSGLRAECAGVAPEFIDDTPERSPSKRILKHFPDYDKRAAAPVIAQAIGLPPHPPSLPPFRRLGYPARIAGAVSVNGLTHP